MQAKLFEMSDAFKTCAIQLFDRASRLYYFISFQGRLSHWRWQRLIWQTGNLTAIPTTAIYASSCEARQIRLDTWARSSHLLQQGQMTFQLCLGVFSTPWQCQLCFFQHVSLQTKLKLCISVGRNQKSGRMRSAPELSARSSSCVMLSIFHISVEVRCQWTVEHHGKGPFGWQGKRSARKHPAGTCGIDDLRGCPVCYILQLAIATRYRRYYICLWLLCSAIRDMVKGLLRCLSHWRVAVRGLVASVHVGGSS